MYFLDKIVMPSLIGMAIGLLVGAIIIGALAIGYRWGAARHPWKMLLRIWHLLVGHAPPSPVVPTDKNGYLLCSCGRQLRAREVKEVGEDHA